MWISSCFCIPSVTFQLLSNPNSNHRQERRLQPPVNLNEFVRVGQGQNKGAKKSDGPGPKCLPSHRAGKRGGLGGILERYADLVLAGGQETRALAKAGGKQGKSIGSSEYSDTGM